MKSSKRYVALVSLIFLLKCFSKSCFNRNLYFTNESRDTLNSFPFFITVKTITRLNLEQSDNFEIKFYKISRRSSCSSDNAEFGHFTLLFCRGRQRNVQRFITGTCTAIVLLITPSILFSDVPVTVTVVVFLTP